MAQNRAAQRAFRERKDNYVKTLETKLEEMESHQRKTEEENERLKSEIELMKLQSSYLQEAQNPFDPKFQPSYLSSFPALENPDSATSSSSPFPHSTNNLEFLQEGSPELTHSFGGSSGHPSSERDIQQSFDSPATKFISNASTYASAPATIANAIGLGNHTSLPHQANISVAATSYSTTSTVPVSFPFDVTADPNMITNFNALPEHLTNPNFLYDQTQGMNPIDLFQNVDLYQPQFTNYRDPTLVNPMLNSILYDNDLGYSAANTSVSGIPNAATGLLDPINLTSLLLNQDPSLAYTNVESAPTTASTIDPTLINAPASESPIISSTPEAHPSSDAHYSSKSEHEEHDPGFDLDGLCEEMRKKATCSAAKQFMDVYCPTKKAAATSEPQYLQIQQHSAPTKQ